MDLEKVTTWVKENKMLAIGVGVLAVGAIAYMMTSSQPKRIPSATGLSGISGSRKKRGRRKHTQNVKLLGLN
jgi:hypothetical protein